MSAVTEHVAIGSVWSFRSPLEFPEQDKRDYPWLAQATRYYKIEHLLDEGGYSIPFRAVPCDAAGNRVFESSFEGTVVLKFPNVDESGPYTSYEQAAREHYSEEKGLIEFRHIRQRLLNCRHANPIIDFDMQWIGRKCLAVTCQPYLDNATQLKHWLAERAPAPNEPRAQWSGLRRWEDWLAAARMLADALASLHGHRVIHGDVWPPNVFVVKDSTEYVKLIDFGESSLFVPAGSMEQNQHPYRAPERDRKLGGHVPTEAVDVYSFGKLLLYITIGEEKLIPRREKGRARRWLIRGWIGERNPTMLLEHPELLNLITRCTAFEPVDRPSMSSIRDELYTADFRASSEWPEEIGVTFKRIAKRYQKLAKQHSAVMKHLVDLKIRELDRILGSADSEMITIMGHRNQVIRGLTALFGELTDGDSWTTITSPQVWHSGGLGLDGRYQTATIRATRRGASIQRAFVVSCEELGVDWCRAFSKELENASKDCGVAGTLGQEFARKSDVLLSIIANPEYEPKVETNVYRDNCERFVDLLASIADTISIWELGKSGLVAEGRFRGIEETKKLFVGLVPVVSFVDATRIRRDNPVSLMCRHDPGIPDQEKWLLVMTDMRGRIEVGRQVNRPQLLGFRVYRSLMNKTGRPHDRIVFLERLMREQAHNVGEVIECIANCGKVACETVYGKTTEASNKLK